LCIPYDAGKKSRSKLESPESNTRKSRRRESRQEEKGGKDI